MGDSFLPDNLSHLGTSHVLEIDPANCTQQPMKKTTVVITTPALKSVSFSNEVSKVDGRAVTIQEEHGVYLPNNDVSSNPFVGREIGGDSGDSWDVGKAISFDMPSKGQETKVEYDNLLVQMGLLKYGHRYRVVVPIPDLFHQDSMNENSRKDLVSEEMQSLYLEEGLTGKHAQNSQENGTCTKTEARIIHDYFEDDDLRGEIETMESGEHHVIITLSARHRGAYCGRLTIELIRLTNDTLSSISPISSNDRELSHNCCAPPKNKAESLEKALISIQVEASIMGKGMGTPKLRDGLVCLGKLGYDSDEETEWQGFG